jgi:hypothetical protein
MEDNVTYEYLVRNTFEDTSLTEEELNQLGSQGWELITTTLLIPHKIKYCFRRLKQNIKMIDNE